MDFISGALPNVMFIAGLIAVGIALGIEFKIVEIKGQLSKHGRIGTFCLGIGLIAISIYLYTRPATMAASPTSPTLTPAAVVQANVVTAPPQGVQATSQPFPTVAAAAAVQPAAVEVEGVIRQIAVRKNQTILTINRAQYMLSPELAVQLGPVLQVGTRLKISGMPMADGSITIANVVVLESGKPEHQGEEHDD